MLNQAWKDEHREAQYFVCDYLIALEKYLTFEDADHIFYYVKSKQWWDTIDSLIKPIGKLGLRDDRIDNLIRLEGLRSSINFCVKIWNFLSIR